MSSALPSGLQLSQRCNARALSLSPGGAQPAGLAESSRGSKRRGDPRYELCRRRHPGGMPEACEPSREGRPALRSAFPTAIVLLTKAVDGGRGEEAVISIILNSQLLQYTSVLAREQDLRTRSGPLSPPRHGPTAIEIGRTVTRSDGASPSPPLGHNPQGWQKVAGGRSAAETPGMSWVVAGILEGCQRPATSAQADPPVSAPIPVCKILFSIRVHPCPSVVKIFFNRMLRRKTAPLRTHV
jgi:hypothetical protein